MEKFIYLFKNTDNTVLAFGDLKTLKSVTGSNNFDLKISEEDWINNNCAAYLDANNEIVLGDKDKFKKDILIKISELKNKLFETDYIASKIAEGSATKEDYAEIILQRQQWRNEINELQEILL